SPPAYPVAPVTPTVHVRPPVMLHDHTQVCMDARAGVVTACAGCQFSAPDLTPSAHRPPRAPPWGPSATTQEPDGVARHRPANHPFLHRECALGASSRRSAWHPAHTVS